MANIRGGFETVVTWERTVPLIPQPRTAFEAEPRQSRDTRRILQLMANAASTGVLHGNTITLDAPVPPFEGQRVRVLIARADDSAPLSSAEQASAWAQWIDHGPQGPIGDDGVLGLSE